MNREELYRLLEIDSPADFDYFEQFADLVETEGDIDEELFCEVLSEVSAASLGEIIENYLEEIGRFLPDGTDDLFTLVDRIEDRLLLLAQGIDHDQFARRSLSEGRYFIGTLETVRGSVADEPERPPGLQGIELDRANRGFGLQDDP